MTIAELMEELWGNILRDLSTDENPDAQSYLWNDTTLLRYIADGQRRFCRATEFLLDASTPAVTEITLTEGVPLYAMHASVLEVKSAQFTDVDGNTTPVVITQRGQVHAQSRMNPPSALGANERAGRPYFAWTDEEQGKIKVYPTPDARADAGVLKLRVSRMPTTIPSLSPVVQLEVTDDDYQLTILEWAAFRALRNHDVDVDNSGVSELLVKASAHKKQFEEDLKKAKSYLKRKRAMVPRFHIDSRTY